MTLYEYLQKAFEEGWKLRYIGLEIRKGNLAAFVAEPQIDYCCNLLHFINNEAHIVIPNYSEFSIHDCAIFSKKPDAREISIHDGNIHVHIELRNQLK